MKFKKLIFISILIVSSHYHTACATPSNSTDKQPRLIPVLKDYTKSMLNKKDEDGGYITAISLTSQCKDNSTISVFAGTRGIHDLTPINENSIFQIGSVTKSFVSLVILQLAEENKINIDDNSVLKKWFPEYPKWGHITLRQLMNMTSGIPGNSNNLPDNIFKYFTAKEYFGYIEPNKILNLTYKFPLHFNPGTQFEYSNTNYILLGQLIKKITHHEPQFEIKKRILNPLGLRNTHFVVDKGDEIPNVDKKQLVHGYAFQSKKSKPYPFMPYGADTLHFSLSYANSSGAMVSTPHDINIYSHSIFEKDGLFNKYENQLTTFVSKQTGKSIKFPTMTDRQGYGQGIIGYYWNKSHPILYAFNGTTDGFIFNSLFDPSTQTYLTVAINSHADVFGLEEVLKLVEKVEKNCL